MKARLDSAEPGAAQSLHETRGRSGRHRGPFVVRVVGAVMPPVTAGVAQLLLY